MPVSLCLMLPQSRAGAGEPGTAQAGPAGHSKSCRGSWSPTGGWGVQGVQRGPGAQDLDLGAAGLTPQLHLHLHRWGGRGREAPAEHLREGWGHEERELRGRRAGTVGIEGQEHWEVRAAPSKSLALLTTVPHSSQSPSPQGWELGARAAPSNAPSSPG